MIRHIVVMKQRPDADPSAVAAARSGAEGLKTLIPGIVKVSFGPNVSTEGLDQGFSLGFTIDFVDAAARDAYLPHPAHLAYIPVAQAAGSEFVVFDLEV